MINFSRTTRWLSFNLTIKLACEHHLWHGALKHCRKYSTKLTHYEVLGINTKATAEDIRAAFIKKSKECHPDTNNKDPNNHKRFILVSEAYSVLSKPLSRRDYDASLLHNLRHEQRMSHHHPTYHCPEFYDQQIYRERDIRYEDYNKSQYSYGASRRARVSNSKIVAACLVFMWIGMIARYLAWRRSTASHMRALDERDAKVHELWMKAKEEGQKYSKEQQLELLLQKQADNKASKLNVINK